MNKRRAIPGYYNGYSALYFLLILQKYSFFLWPIYKCSISECIRMYFESFLPDENNSAKYRRNIVGFRPEVFEIFTSGGRGRVSHRYRRQAGSAILEGWPACWSLSLARRSFGPLPSPPAGRPSRVGGHSGRWPVAAAGADGRLGRLRPCWAAVWAAGRLTGCTTLSHVLIRSGFSCLKKKVNKCRSVYSNFQLLFYECWLETSQYNVW